MTRGKYATRADAISAATSVLTEVDSYQHAVRRLTRERDDARSELAAVRRAHLEEVRRLRAQVDAGLSVELATTQTALRREREDRGTAEQRLKDSERKRDGEMKTYWEHLRQDHGGSAPDIRAAGAYMSRAGVTDPDSTAARRLIHSITEYRKAHGVHYCDELDPGLGQ